MSKREEFKAALKEFYDPNWKDVWKAYERIHPPEFKPGDYVTYISGKCLSVNTVSSIRGDYTITTTGNCWDKDHLSHSTPEEIAVYNKRINDEIYT